MLLERILFCLEKLGLSLSALRRGPLQEVQDPEADGLRKMRRPRRGQIHRV